MNTRVLSGLIVIVVLLLGMYGRIPLQAQDSMNLFEIVSPLPGQVVAGPTLPISVNFRTGDGVPVVRFDVYLNDKLFYGNKPYGGTLEVPALEGRFNTDDAQSPANIERAGLKSGQNTVTVRLTDAQGRVFSRSQLFVYQPIAPRPVGERNAPRVRILEPYNGAHIDSRTRITVEALDDSGILWVKILINDRMRAMGNTSPFELDWDPIAEGFSVGSHYIMARALDLFENVGDSEPVLVWIENPWNGDGLTRPQGDFDLLVKPKKLFVPGVTPSHAPVMPPLFSGSTAPRVDAAAVADDAWAIVPARVIKPNDQSADTSWVDKPGSEPVVLTPIAPTGVTLKSNTAPSMSAVISTRLTSLLPADMVGSNSERRELLLGSNSDLPIYLPRQMLSPSAPVVNPADFIAAKNAPAENIIPLHPMEIASMMRQDAGNTLPIIHHPALAPSQLTTPRRDPALPAITITIPNHQGQPNQSGTGDDWAIILPTVASADDQVALWVPAQVDMPQAPNSINNARDFSFTLGSLNSPSREVTLPEPAVTMALVLPAKVSPTGPTMADIAEDMLTAPRTIASAPATNPLDGFKTKYTVKSGDTLSKIARALNTTVAKLAQMNPGINVDRLHPGETLVLPRKELHVTVDNRDLAAMPEPYIAGRGYTMVSMRAMVEAKGGVIVWVPKSRQVNAWVGNNAMSVTIGTREARINSQVYLLPISATLRDSRTMVPLRFMMQGMNLSLEYDAASQQYMLTSEAE